MTIPATRNDPIPTFEAKVLRMRRTAFGMVHTAQLGQSGGDFFAIGMFSSRLTRDSHLDRRATTHGTTSAQLARATYEAVAQQIADVFAAMAQDIGAPLASQRADGGASGNAFLMQVQAGLPGCPVQTADVEDVGALGAAAMAFDVPGVAMPLPEPARTYVPEMADAIRQRLKPGWRTALARSRR